MRRYTKIVTALLFSTVAALSLASCHTDNYREICDYKVQLRYDYNEENRAEVNMIEYYVYSIDEYIFREDGILFQHRLVTPDRCTEYLNSEIDLPPGKYSVIAVGNRDERSEVSDGSFTRSGTRAANTPMPGITHRDNMLLSLENSVLHPDGTHGPSENLYYGYRTFTVKERGISRIRVDMMNSHFRLIFRVTWKNGATPDRNGSYFALLESVPSRYRRMPEYVYPAGKFVSEVYDGSTHDHYQSNSNDVIHYIPTTCYLSQNVLRHRNDMPINADREMWGEFTTYRLKSSVRPQLRFFAEDPLGGAPTQIVRDIDLQAYFDWYDHDLDTELRQHYEIDIVIDGDKIILLPLNVADWDEGGVIN